MLRGRVIRASQLLGRESVNIDSGVSAGVVRDLLLAVDGSLASVGIEPHAWFEPGRACPPDALIGASSTRLLVSTRQRFERFRVSKEDRPLLWSAICGLPLVSTEGETLGDLADLTFDLPSGRLSAAHVGQPDGEVQQILVQRLAASGPDCVIAEVGQGKPALEAETQRTSEPEEREPAAVQAREEAPLRAAAAAACAVPVELTQQRIEARLAGLLLASAEAQTISERSSGYVDADSTPAAAPAEKTREIVEPEAFERIVTGRAPSKLGNVAPGHDSLALDAGQGGLSPAQPTALERLGAFAQRKVQYLLGRRARRDICAPDGTLIAAGGAELTHAMLEAIAEAGVFDSVFLEHSAYTRSQ